MGRQVGPATAATVSCAARHQRRTPGRSHVARMGRPPCRGASPARLLAFCYAHSLQSLLAAAPPAHQDVARQCALNGWGQDGQSAEEHDVRPATALVSQHQPLSSKRGFPLPHHAHCPTQSAASVRGTPHTLAAGWSAPLMLQLLHSDDGRPPLYVDCRARPPAYPQEVSLAAPQPQSGVRALITKARTCMYVYAHGVSHMHVVCVGV